MVATVGSQRELAPEMLYAAHALIGGLGPEQRTRVLLPFDEEVRLTWHFTPRPRRGLPLGEMAPYQKQLAQVLLSTGLSSRGYAKVVTIMSLEQVLYEFEPARRFARDPELYYFSIFGEPGERGTWGWRVEGHHVSFHFTIQDGRVLASSPSFFGANPAEVKLGPRAGLRVLEAEEELARELLRSLDGAQHEAALIDPVAPPDLLTYNHALIDPERPAGVSSAALKETQRALLMALIGEYAKGMPPEIAVPRLEKARGANPRDLFFAWAGGAERGQGHYYRIQAPAFLIEYDCTQNEANHIHSVWREYRGDFGRDPLRLHLQAGHGIEA